MFLKLKKGVLKGILSRAYEKAGTIYKLVGEVNIPKSTLSAYHNEIRIINDINFEKLIGYLNITRDNIEIIEKLPSNWRQVKGGKNCVLIKKKNGTFEKQLRECRERGGSDYLRKWHANMKKENLEKYYELQYQRFKKVGNYKFKTDNGEMVRNKLEKDVADLLKSMGKNYRYEAFVKIGKKCFFPDFLIDGKLIIECTFWRGTDKAIKLKEKIRYLKQGYKTYVLIPKTLKRYYETLNNHLITGIENLPSIFEKSE